MPHKTHVIQAEQKKIRIELISQYGESKLYFKDTFTNNIANMIKSYCKIK